MKLLKTFSTLSLALFCTLPLAVSTGCTGPPSTEPAATEPAVEEGGDGETSERDMSSSEGEAAPVADENANTTN